MIPCFKIKTFKSNPSSKGTQYTILLKNGVELKVSAEQYLSTNITDLISYYVDTDGTARMIRKYPYIKNDSLVYPESKYIKTDYKIFDVKLH